MTASTHPGSLLLKWRPTPDQHFQIQYVLQVCGAANAMFILLAFPLMLGACLYDLPCLAGLQGNKRVWVRGCNLGVCTLVHAHDPCLPSVRPLMMPANSTRPMQKTMYAAFCCAMAVDLQTCDHGELLTRYAGPAHLRRVVLPFLQSPAQAGELEQHVAPAA